MTDLQWKFFEAFKIEFRAKVQERLARVALRQRCAAHVVGTALGHARHLSASAAEAPAEVYLFHVGKKSAVETTARLPILAANHQRGTRGPEQGRGIRHDDRGNLRQGIHHHLRFHACRRK